MSGQTANELRGHRRLDGRSDERQRRRAGAGAPARDVHLGATRLRCSRSRPLLGRGFLPEDDRPGAPAVVDLEPRRLDRAATAVTRPSSGASVRINNVPTSIVGVMPAGFKFPFIAEAWQPLVGASPGGSRRRRRACCGTCSDGSRTGSIRHGRGAELAAIAALWRMTGSGYAPRSCAVSVTSLKDGYAAGARRPLLLTFMARGRRRAARLRARTSPTCCWRAPPPASREMAVRASLGATALAHRPPAAGRMPRARVARRDGRPRALALRRPRDCGRLQPHRAWACAAASSRPFWLDLSFDGSVLAFVGVAAASSRRLVFGLVPALHVARVDVNGVFKDGGRGGSERAPRASLDQRLHHRRDGADARAARRRRLVVAQLLRHVSCGSSASTPSGVVSDAVDAACRGSTTRPTSPSPVRLDRASKQRLRRRVGLSTSTAAGDPRCRSPSAAPSRRGHRSMAWLPRSGRAWTPSVAYMPVSERLLRDARRSADRAGARSRRARTAPAPRAPSSISASRRCSSPTPIRLDAGFV